MQHGLVLVDAPLGEFPGSHVVDVVIKTLIILINHGNMFYKDETDLHGGKFMYLNYCAHQSSCELIQIRLVSGLDPLYYPVEVY